MDAARAREPDHPTRPTGALAYGSRAVRPPHGGRPWPESSSWTAVLVGAEQAIG
jgi:hypothetical protein